MAKKKDNTIFWVVAAAAAIYFFKDKLGMGGIGATEPKQTLVFKNNKEMMEYNAVYSNYFQKKKDEEKEFMDYLKSFKK
jgi:hypothetical protein